ncbi:hypothetical protein [Thermodesulforhabdus norvegica]|uniref:Uncharacterized protein n=1 Tax=Thermodesulforhabdus norvegica TaxID=39841 RepID=A0A1I4SSB2_9BACT|nr:hypothetical protein [Thermodesulforhabdus norvegica]SFM67386.1 hypothetical protein SAMN05660836_01139 [Thermodesulforhabdus norvegica]
MGLVIDLTEKKYDMMAREAFGSLARRFGCEITGQTCLKDLNDSFISFFLPISPTIFHILSRSASKIIFFRHEGKVNLDEDQEKRMMVLNLTLFLADQIRFEAMYRLRWVLDFPTRHIPIVRLIADFHQKYSNFERFTPALSPEHPSYHEYDRVADTSDKAAVVRRLIPDLIKAFQESTPPDR